jgi:putative transposase
VHLLISEPERRKLAVAVQMFKQVVSRKLHSVTFGGPFWQARHYDFNVWSERKRVEKLRYIHQNPGTRGLVEKPQDWRRSSFRHYATGEDSVVD